MQINVDTSKYLYQRDGEQGGLSNPMGDQALLFFQGKPTGIQEDPPRGVTKRKKKENKKNPPTLNYTQ